MKYEELLEVSKEAKRFLVLIEKAKDRFKGEEIKKAVTHLRYIYPEFGCKETAAVKRASMDLSRVLTKLRKGIKCLN